jgi:GT2 family glycosyltransferase
MDDNKIGIGIITCDRPHFLKKSLDKILSFPLVKSEKAILIIIDDGNNPVSLDEGIKYIKTSGRIGVAKAKNLALKYMMDHNCSDYFLLEDDIEILSDTVFDAYIQASNKTGIQHFNYALHGNHNRQNGMPVIRKSIEYPNGQVIDLYGNLLGALSYFTKKCLDEVGLIDETFYNAMEHVDHTYQIIKKGFHPPFRWFADISNTDGLIRDIVEDHKESVIRSQENFQETFKNGLDQFIKKNNFSVVQGYGPQETIFSLEDTKKSLKKMWDNVLKKK